MSKEIILNNITINTCTHHDIDGVLKLQHDWVKEDSTIGLSNADVDYIESKLGKYFLLAQVESQIVGYAFASIHKAMDMAVFKDGEVYIEIDDLYIKDEYRGQGIGKKLLEELLSRAEKVGIKRSLIYSSVKDIDPVKNFYEKQGFQTWYIQMYK